MRRPIVSLLFAGLWWSCAGAGGQTQTGEQLSAWTVSEETPGDAAKVALEGSVAGLPDSPGAVPRRRMEIERSEPEPDEAETPQQAADRKAESSAARASDRRSTAACGTAANGGGRAGVNTTVATSTPGLGPTPGRTAMGASGGASGVGRGASPGPCPAAAPNPYQRFLNSTAAIPLTPKQKGYLAYRNFIDPGNIVTILGTSAIAIASDSHTAYGPGLKGFGENAGLSFVQDATGDFFGTFLIPAIAHEDPHYHRRPEASVPRRLVHAISRTVIAQADDGHAIPNYSTLLTYPIAAEISNLYVPGVAGNGPSTVERILTGYATDPIDNLITEFLPDVAKRVHVRVIFVQQIINQVAAGQPVSMF